MEKIPEPLFSRELFEDYKKKVGRLLHIENPQVHEEVYREIAAFASMLRNTYRREDLGKLALFHVLAGSTIVSEMSVNGDDLSGPDSIAHFIDNLMEEHKDYLPSQI